jgi:hypothetical protein
MDGKGDGEEVPDSHYAGSNVEIYYQAGELRVYPGLSCALLRTRRLRGAGLGLRAGNVRGTGR